MEIRLHSNWNHPLFIFQEYNVYGWWVGELNSLIGIVPKEYLTTAFEMEEIWSPGIKTMASKSIGHAFISLWGIGEASGVAFPYFHKRH